ncbi:SEC63 domain-containing protein [Entamoeba marina]
MDKEKQIIYESQKRAYHILTDSNKRSQWMLQHGRYNPTKTIVALPCMLDREDIFMFLYFLVYITIYLMFALFLVFININKKKTKQQILNEKTVNLLTKFLDLHPTTQSLLEILCASNEIQQYVHYHQNDDKTLPSIRSKVIQDLLKTPRWQNREIAKAQTLLCAHISRVKLPQYLKQVLLKMLPETEKIIDGMISYYFSNNSIEGMIKCIRLNQMLQQACTLSTEYYQLPEFESTQIPLMKGISSSKLAKLSPSSRLEKLKQICLTEQQLNLWKKYFMYYPGGLTFQVNLGDSFLKKKPVIYTIVQSFDPKTHKMLSNVELPCSPHVIKAHTPYFHENIEETFYIIVEIENVQTVCHKSKTTIPFSSNPTTVKLLVNIPINVPVLKFSVYIISTCYIGCEYCSKKNCGCFV